MTLGDVTGNFGVGVTITGKLASEAAFLVRAGSLATAQQRFLA